MSSKSSILIAVPHAATQLPEGLAQCLASQVDQRFLRAQTDVFTDRVYDLPGIATEHYPWHRFVADPNRRPDDLRPLGVVPTLAFDGSQLYQAGREPAAEDIAQRVRRFHEPYHQALAQALSDGVKLLVDGHSMAAVGPESSFDRSRPRPQACVGNCGDERGDALAGDIISCEPEFLRWSAQRLCHHLQRCLEDESPVDVRVNQPFRGGYGIRRHARPGSGIQGIQLELNQGLWWSEEDGLDEDRVTLVRQALSDWTLDLVEKL